MVIVMSDSRKEFEAAFPMPEKSEITWNESKQRYFTPRSLYKETALAKSHGFEGWQACKQANNSADEWCREHGHRKFARRSGEICSCPKYTAIELLEKIDNAKSKQEKDHG